MKIFYQFIIIGLFLFVCSCGIFKPKYDTDYWEDYYSKIDSVSSTIDYYTEDENINPNYSISEPYQASYTIINDLISTKLDVKFDWAKQQMPGKATLIFKPHFYPTDSLTLDAKYMNINNVELLSTATNKTLAFIYDSLQLRIKLDKTYTNNESYTIYIEYTAKPNEVKAKGSDAITDAKGLYFINADGKDLSKPREIWTQGETESNSCWFPTIDKPNMKTIFEINITTEKEMTTLSNGIMVSSKLNADGTHTDTWKMDKPFAPYLAMMAVGNFTIVKDKWKNIEVNYYLDPSYGPYARDIFGNTPEMLDFYSKKFGYDYPWQKYSQVVVHDFVSGAMENVSATVHYEGLNETRRELIDNNHEDIICHELSHHWFGDLVTCESWSNIPLNESFATFSEFLWLTYKYGSDEGDYHVRQDLYSYFNESESKQLPLIRFNYSDREDMFDRHSYEKGGYILRMLYKYVGEDAFTAAISLYLKSHEYGSVEVNDLRLAFEKITGEDLNWFFNQWFLNASHPVVDINYVYSDTANTVAVIVNQYPADMNATNLSYWRLPIDIDIYSNGAVKRHRVWFNSADTVFKLPAYSKPDLVNVDADNILLWQKNDNKTSEEYAFQYLHANGFKNRSEAVDYILSLQVEDFDSTISTNFNASQALINIINNEKFWRLKEEAIQGLTWNKTTVDKAKILLIDIAQKDPSSNVRAAALDKLYMLFDSTLSYLFINACKDSSYKVISTALYSLNSLNKQEALVQAKNFIDEKNEEISSAVLTIYSNSTDTSLNSFFLNKLNTTYGPDKFSQYVIYGRYLSNLNLDVALRNIEYLFNAATTEKEWTNRYAAINAIESVKESWEENVEDYSQKLSEIDSSNPEYEKMKTELSKMKQDIKQLEDRIDKIREAENNDILKNFLNSEK